MGFRIRKFVPVAVAATANVDDGHLLESTFIQAFQQNRDQARSALLSMLRGIDRQVIRFAVLRGIASKYGVTIPEPEKKKSLRRKKQKAERRTEEFEDYNNF